ncbi:TetR/AcrR family transcriptional regulator [Jatrophihabitans sp. YIM 134969]
MSGQTLQSPPSARPMRADARRNYDALLEAATATFAEAGVESAALEQIAKRAGVGIGTLYRHFPTRDDLVLAVYEREVSDLCDAAPQLIAAHPADPDVALEQWMQRFVAYVATKRGLASTLHALRARADAADDHVFADLQARIRASLGTLVDAASASGRIRPGVDHIDLMRAVGGVCMATDDDGWQDRTQRIIGLLLDGLKYGAPNPRP